MAGIEMSTDFIQTEPQTRQQPEGQPGQYISDTFNYIQTVKDFCDRETEWTCLRELEIKDMTAPKSCTDTVLLCCGLKTAKNELEDILKGLQDLCSFLNAVEKLAVMDESFPLEGLNAEAMQSVISAARTVSPLLIHFKREDGAFFSPEPDNVDLLDKYTRITKLLCKEMRSSKILEVTGILEQQPEDQPGQYISDTFNYIKTVKDFCNRETEWTRQRKLEIKDMMAPKTWIDKVLLFCGLKKAKNELEAILSDTLKGLQDLRSFLDAVEKLAVTSPSVFMDESFALEGMNAEAVQSMISAARTVSPLLIHFKREDGAFFSPEPNLLDPSMDLLVHQLHKYICITKSMCKKMRSSKILEVTEILDHTSQLSFSTDHLNQLSTIRMDESFRLTYLFDAKEFVNEYDTCRTKMLKSLSGLEANAVCLDRMKCAYSVCTIIGSLIGIIGGHWSIAGILEHSLSIAGLVRTPQTLAWLGGALGLVSVIINLLTGLIEFTVNKYYVKKAKSNIYRFMKNMQKVVDCLEQTASSQRPAPHLDEASIELGVMKAMSQFRKISKSIDIITDVTAVLKPLDFSKRNRFMTFAGNIPSFLADVFFFCKELWSICKRKKSNVSQLIYSRTALWRSEMEAWKRIKECLREEVETFQKNKAILEMEIRQ